ncbi:hypothetical protein GW17_00039744 [Ensete ventricosum]|nr:hypothetical protein GW17_00039744 [Ensete ventricosum]
MRDYRYTTTIDRRSDGFDPPVQFGDYSVVAYKGSEDRGNYLRAGHRQGQLLLVKALTRVAACGQAACKGGRLRPGPLARAIAHDQPTRDDRSRAWLPPTRVAPAGMALTSRQRQSATNSGAQRCRLRRGDDGNDCWKMAERT